MARLLMIGHDRSPLRQRMASSHHTPGHFVARLRLAGFNARLGEVTTQDFTVHVTGETGARHGAPADSSAVISNLLQDDAPTAQLRIQLERLMTLKDATAIELEQLRKRKADCQQEEADAKRRSEAEIEQLLLSLNEGEDPAAEGFRQRAEVEKKILEAVAPADVFDDVVEAASKRLSGLEREVQSKRKRLPTDKACDQVAPGVYRLPLRCTPMRKLLTAVKTTQEIKVTKLRTLALGAEVEVSGSGDGLLVRCLKRGGAGQLAGLQVGDVIQAVSIPKEKKKSRTPQEMATFLAPADFCLVHFFDHGQRSGAITLDRKASASLEDLSDAFIRHCKKAGLETKGALVPHVSGLKWSKIGDVPHTQKDRTKVEKDLGKKLEPGEAKVLEQELTRKLEFTAVEWNAFRVKNLRADSFVKSGNSYFRPVAVPVLSAEYRDRLFEDFGLKVSKIVLQPTETQRREYDSKLTAELRDVEAELRDVDHLRQKQEEFGAEDKSKSPKIDVEIASKDKPKVKLAKLKTELEELEINRGDCLEKCEVQQLALAGIKIGLLDLEQRLVHRDIEIQQEINRDIRHSMEIQQEMEEIQRQRLEKTIARQVKDLAVQQNKLAGIEIKLLELEQRLVHRDIEIQQETQSLARRASEKLSEKRQRLEKEIARKVKNLAGESVWLVDGVRVGTENHEINGRVLKRIGLGRFDDSEDEDEAAEEQGSSSFWAHVDVDVAAKAREAVKKGGKKSTFAVAKSGFEDMGSALVKGHVTSGLAAGAAGLVVGAIGGVHAAASAATSIIAAGVSALQAVKQNVNDVNEARRKKEKKHEERRADRIAAERHELVLEIRRPGLMQLAVEQENLAVMLKLSEAIGGAGAGVIHVEPVVLSAAFDRALRSTNPEAIPIFEHLCALCQPSELLAWMMGTRTTAQIENAFRQGGQTALDAQNGLAAVLADLDIPLDDTMKRRNPDLCSVAELEQIIENGVCEHPLAISSIYLSTPEHASRPFSLTWLLSVRCRS